MNDIFNIAFADDRGELKWFSLSPTALSPCPAHDETVGANLPARQQEKTVTEPDLSGRSARLKDTLNILILPATAGLPFQIELSFEDPVKIARVIPQFVADQYAEVNETWLFSWMITSYHSDANLAGPDPIGRTAPSDTKLAGAGLRAGPQKPEPVTEPDLSGRSARYKIITSQQPPKFVVSGIAFPPEFSPARLAPDISWRLALPDFLLASASAKSALHLKTPCADYIALFSGPNQLQRVIADSSLPLRPILAAAGITAVTEHDLSADIPALNARLKDLLGSSSNFDLSGYRQQLIGSALRWSLSAAVALILGLIFISHLFLWFECRLTEAAADRTRLAMTAAFNQVFPGSPVVDAVSQTRRKIAEAQNSLKEAGSIPDVPWLKVLQLTALAADAKIRLGKIQGRSDGFRFQGHAADYTSLEAFRRAIEASGLVEKVTLPESRKSGDEVLFALEAKWKS